MGFLALALLILPQAGAAAQAFVELRAQPASVYVEQPLRVTIRFGVEREFLRHNLLQLFTRPLDVPVQLELSWESGLANTQALDPGEEASGSNALAPHPSFALGEEIVKAARSSEEQREGQTFVVLELERALLPLAPGRLEIPGPVLHYAFATRFEQDLVSGSVPLDRSSAALPAAPLAIDVLPLPAEGRPAGFGNAVGRFTLAVEAQPRELEAGETLKLALVIEGQGNLGHLSPPRLDGLPGLHLLASTEELSGQKRTLHCELVAESPRTREIPAIVLDYFDPDARAFGRAATQPIPLQVRARAPVGVAGAHMQVKPALYVLYGVGLLLLAAIAAGVARLLRRR
jgi:hypothetical protein